MKFKCHLEFDCLPLYRKSASTVSTSGVLAVLVVYEQYTSDVLAVQEMF